MGRGRVVAAPRQHWGSPGCCFQPGIPGDAHLRGGQGRCRVPVTSQLVSLGLGAARATPGPAPSFG